MHLFLFVHRLSIESICELIEQDADSNAEAVARIVGIITTECISMNYTLLLDYYQDVENNYYLNLRQTAYESCQLFGWFLTSDSDNQPFGNSFPEEFFFKYCEIIFGSRYCFKCAA